jgi:hypothetical protein
VNTVATTKSFLLLLALVVFALMLARCGFNPHGVTGFFDGH